MLADLKGGSAVKPFGGVPHVSRIITDLEEDQALMERFLDALWGEIARRKAVCDNAGVDDAKEYNRVRSRMRARGQDMPPLPMLVVVIDEFYEWFRIMPTAVDVLDSIGRQGRAYWIHLMMASQTIESRAEKLMENMGYRLVLKARTAGAAQAAGVPNAVNLPAQAGLGYFRKSLEDIVRFQAEFLWRDYYSRGVTIDGEEAPRCWCTASITFARNCLPTRSPRSRSASAGRTSTLPRRSTANGEVLEAGDAEEDEDEEGDQDAEGRHGDHRSAAQDRLRALPLVAAAADRARRHRRVGQPIPRPPVAAGLRHRAGSGVPDRDHRPAVQARPAAVDGRHLRAGCQRPDSGRRRFGQDHGVADADLLGRADPHARAGPVLLPGLQQHRVDHGRRVLPHVGEVVGPTDPYGVRRTVAELLALVRERKRSFLEYGIASMEVFRRRKFGGEAGPVPNDGFGDVYLVIDNYRALAEENEVLIEQVNQIINQGPSFGVHVVVTADRESELRPPVRSGFGSRIELRLAAVEDAKLVRSRFAKDVPVKPGRGMVAVNYVRLDSDPQAGLHTLVARPALASTPDNVFESDSVVAAVSRLASGQAPPVRRLPARFGVEQVRELAARDTPPRGWRRRNRLGDHRNWTCSRSTSISPRMRT